MKTAVFALSAIVALDLTAGTIGSPAMPEAIADSMRSDGVGYVDLGYRYHGSSFPKTSRVVCELYDDSWGSGRSPGIVMTSSNPRTIFGYQDSASGSMSAARYNGGSVGLIYYGAWLDDKRANVGRYDTVVTIDYRNETASWSSYDYVDGGLVHKMIDFEEVTRPNQDAVGSYWLFANNVYSGQYLWPSIITFKSIRFYECQESGEEALVSEYVPCISGGEYGVYDRLRGIVCPVINHNGGFKLSGVKWRLTAGDEVDYVSGRQTVAAPAGTDAWVLMRDSDGAVIAGGRGASCEFTMPECASTLVFTEDVAVGEGETYTIDREIASSSVSLAAGSTLEFLSGGRLMLFGSTALPETGKVNVACRQAEASGLYTLAVVQSGSLDLSRFEAVGLPEGLMGTFELRDRELCLRVHGENALYSQLPDKILSSLRNDGAGHVDLGYRYHGSSFPKTSRVVCELYDDSWGSGRSPGIVMTDGNPRTIFGYQDSAKGSLSAARYNGGSNGLIYYGAWLMDKKAGVGRFDTQVTIDYRNETASWSSYDVIDGVSFHKLVNFDGVTRPNQDAVCSYWLFANNVYSGQFLWPSIISFINIRFYEYLESGEEKLARDFVPAMKDGAPCVFDKITLESKFLQAHTNGYVIGAISWPAEIFPAVTQRLDNVVAVSAKPVAVPDFAPEREYVFVADGKIVLKRAVERVELVSYDASGSVVSTSAVDGPAIGDEIPVAVGASMKTVAKLVGAASPSVQVVQNFDIAVSESQETVSERVTAKYSRRFMVSSPATFAFKADVDSVVASSYDASGTLVATKNISGAVAAGNKLAVEVGEGIGYLILDVELSRPGLRFIVR